MEYGSSPDSESESTTVGPKPQPPIDAPKYAVEPLDSQSPGLLREIGQYARKLAEWKESKRAAELAAVDRGRETPDDWDEEEWDDELDEAFDEAGIPRSKGSITVNQIDGRGYFYLKWSENGEFKSQYIAPVEPKERGSSD
jgi:hypothetical protein